MLLIGAGLLLRSFDRLQNVEPGFRPGNLLVADVPVSPRAYSQAAARMNYIDRLLDRARALPGVTSAGAAAFLPVSGRGSQIHFNIQGRAPRTPRDFIIVGYRPVSPRYLETIGVPLRRGRLLTDADSERGPFVAVINEAMARQFFPDREPDRPTRATGTDARAGRAVARDCGRRRQRQADPGLGARRRTLLSDPAGRHGAAGEFRLARAADRQRSAIRRRRPAGRGPRDRPQPAAGQDPDNGGEHPRRPSRSRASARPCSEFSPDARCCYPSSVSTA